MDIGGLWVKCFTKVLLLVIRKHLGRQTTHIKMYGGVVLVLGYALLDSMPQSISLVFFIPIFFSPLNNHN